jgi:hypothetical protein
MSDAVAKWQGINLCVECRQLLHTFGEAVHDVVTLNELHFRAVIDDEPNPHRFDLLIHAATERKQNAKYAYVQHLETHGCSIDDETDAD